MDLRTAVIIATKGRPKEVSGLLFALEQQSRRPDTVVVSACESGDLLLPVAERIQTILGSPGSSVQRNRGLTAVAGKAEIVVFFDDDFVPSKFWIEHARAFFTAHPDVVCLTGRVLYDGAIAGSIPSADGQAIVDREDSAAKPFAMPNCMIRENETPYGCNMAIRADKLGQLRFDENLILYGWLEDRDFGIRAAVAGRTVRTDVVWGVHLGARSGRGSGVRFGYSQIVNPWYLMTKGVLTPAQAGQNIIRGLLSNTVGRMFLKSAVDRHGRLWGNLIAMKDIICGAWTPARIETL